MIHFVFCFFGRNLCVKLVGWLGWVGLGWVGLGWLFFWLVGWFVSVLSRLCCATKQAFAFRNMRRLDGLPARYGAPRTAGEYTWGKTPLCFLAAFSSELLTELLGCLLVCAKFSG